MTNTMLTWSDLPMITYDEFVDRLKAKHGEIESRCFKDHPGKIFFFDIPEPTGIDTEIAWWRSPWDYYIAPEADANAENM